MSRITATVTVSDFVHTTSIESEDSEHLTDEEISRVVQRAAEELKAKGYEVGVLARDAGLQVSVKEQATGFEKIDLARWVGVRNDPTANGIAAFQRMARLFSPKGAGEVVKSPSAPLPPPPPPPSAPRLEKGVLVLGDLSRVPKDKLEVELHHQTCVFLAREMIAMYTSGQPPVLDQQGLFAALNAMPDNATRKVSYRDETGPHEVIRGDVKHGIRHQLRLVGLIEKQADQLAPPVAPLPPAKAKKDTRSPAARGARPVGQPVLKTTKRTSGGNVLN